METVTEPVGAFAVIPVSSSSHSPEDIPEMEDRLQYDERGKERNGSASSSVDGASYSTGMRQPEQDSMSQTPDNEDHVLFHNVVYLGAATVRSPRSEAEILKNLTLMNDAYTRNNENETAIKVDLLVPRVPQGMLVLYAPQTEEEISKYPVFRIIFCARGAKVSDRNDPLSSCFAFTFGMGNCEEAVFLCHAFRCQNSDQVQRIITCFSSAFRKPVTSQLPQGESVFVFDVCVEVKEDDGKGSYVYCPRESRDCFKIRTNLMKSLVIQILQVSPENPHLSLDKCTCVLLAAGKNVNRSDFNVLPMTSWDNNGKQFSISCTWDPRDEKFLLLNTETPGEHRSHMTIVVVVAIAGVTQTVTFVLHCRARIYPQVEKFWMPGRRSLQETFFLRLLWKPVEPGTNQKGYYNIVSLESQSKREGKEQDIASLLENSSSSSDDDEPANLNEDPLSGSGQVSKECSEEDLVLWSEVLTTWRENLSLRPRTLAALVRRRGIPQSLRCEVWQLLSGCANCDQLLEEYKTLSNQDSHWEAEITKDISRTFPAHEYFKTKGSEGQDQLFRVVKAYAVRDTQTGYCQNISFIAATLLLHMPEELAFCILVKIMEDYEMRDLMKNDFEGLRLCFFQTQRLLEEKTPDLYYHFRDAGVEMHMFASQWFLTLFTAKFPLICVFRILDLFLCDGRLVMFQIAIGLLKIARPDLLQLDFEGILTYFRVTLPKKFKTEDWVSMLINHAVHEKIPHRKIVQYEKEFAAIRAEDTNESALERLKRQSREQMASIMRLERENDQLAHELINGKIQLRNELDDAETQIDLQQKEIFRLNSAVTENEDEIKRTRDESALVKELCRKIESENKQQSKSINEYKAINSRLVENLDKETANIEQLFSKACDICKHLFKEQCDPIPSVKQPEDERIKQLELELARTKLALVEKECYTQELLHQLALSSASAAAQSNSDPSQSQNAKNSWLSKTFNSIKSQTALVVTSSSTTSPSENDARDKRSNSLQTVSKIDSNVN